MSYVDEMETQLFIGIDLFFSQLDKITEETKKQVYVTQTLDKLDANVGGRPCLENAISGLIDAMTELAFEWKGKNKTIVWNTQNGKDNYKHRVIGSAVGSYAGSFNKNNQNVFNKKTKNEKSQMMYNKFKHLPVNLARTKFHVPTYWNVNKIPNGKTVTMEAIDEYLNYL